MTDRTGEIHEGVFSIEDLVPDPKNPRRHTERGMAMLARSLREFGATRGVVIDENGRVLAGNGVIDAAADVGINKVRVIDVEGDELVAVQVKHLDEEQKARYALADNRTSDLSGWDSSQLLEVMNDGIDLSSFWSSDDLDEMMTTTRYRPSLEPVAEWTPIDASAVEYTREAMEAKIASTPVFKIVELTCPNCGKPVAVRK